MSPELDPLAAAALGRRAVGCRAGPRSRPPEPTSESGAWRWRWGRRRSCSSSSPASSSPFTARTTAPPSSRPGRGPPQRRATSSTSSPAPGGDALPPPDLAAGGPRLTDPSVGPPHRRPLLHHQQRARSAGAPARPDRRVRPARCRRPLPDRRAPSRCGAGRGHHRAHDGAPVADAVARRVPRRVQQHAAQPARGRAQHLRALRREHGRFGPAPDHRVAARRWARLEWPSWSPTGRAWWRGAPATRRPPPSAPCVPTALTCA